MSAKTKKPMARKVVSTFESKLWDHRGTFTICPDCAVTFEDEVWEKASIILVLDTVHGKHGSVVVVSECPKCFGKSWVHRPFSSFSDWHEEYPADWKVAANAERERRHIEAVHTFCDSKCNRCVHLKSLEVETLPIVECTMGRDETRVLPPGRKHHRDSHFTKTECDKFQART